VRRRQATPGTPPRSRRRGGGWNGAPGSHWFPDVDCHSSTRRRVDPVRAISPDRPETLVRYLRCHALRVASPPVRPIELRATPWPQRASPPDCGEPPPAQGHTRDEIKQLYEAHRKGAYAGREAEWARQDADIIAGGANSSRPAFSLMPSIAITNPAAAARPRPCLVEALPWPGHPDTAHGPPVDLPFPCPSLKPQKPGAKNLSQNWNLERCLRTANTGPDYVVSNLRPRGAVSTLCGPR
jgi:hypothetical protein